MSSPEDDKQSSRDVGPEAYRQANCRSNAIDTMLKMTVPRSKKGLGLISQIVNAVVRAKLALATW